MKSNQIVLLCVISFIYFTLLLMAKTIDFFPSPTIVSSNLIANLENQIMAPAATTAQTPAIAIQHLQAPPIKNVTPDTFQSTVINPVLKKLDLYTPSTSTLLLGTAIQESMIGKLSKNIFQITLSTARDINKNYLIKHPALQSKVNYFYMPQHSLAWNIRNNVPYQTALATVVYLKSNKPIPTTNNLQTLATFWKVHYNTYDGKGSAREYARHLQYYLVNDDVPISHLQI